MNIKGSHIDFFENLSLIRSPAGYDKMVSLYKLSLSKWIEKGYFNGANLLVTENDFDNEEICHDYYEYSGLDLTVYNSSDYSFELQYDEGQRTFNFQILDYDSESGMNLLAIDLYIDRDTQKCTFRWRDLCTEEMVTTSGYSLDVTEEQYFQNLLLEDNIFTFEEFKVIFAAAKTYYQYHLEVYVDELKALP